MAFLVVRGRGGAAWVLGEKGVACVGHGVMFYSLWDGEGGKWKGEDLPITSNQIVFYCIFIIILFPTPTARLPPFMCLDVGTVRRSDWSYKHPQELVRRLRALVYPAAVAQ